MEIASLILEENPPVSMPDCHSTDFHTPRRDSLCISQRDSRASSPCSSPDSDSDDVGSSYHSNNNSIPVHFQCTKQDKHEKYKGKSIEPKNFAYGLMHASKSAD